MKANYNEMSEFGKDIPALIAAMAIRSPETILKYIEREGSYKLDVNGKAFELRAQHFIRTRDTPAHAMVAFGYGTVFLSKATTPALEAEGFARELTRQVQDLRKKAGLQKAERIDLFVKVSSELARMLLGHQQALAGKVGARRFEISVKDPAAPYAVKEKGAIKKEAIEISLSKV